MQKRLATMPTTERDIRAAVYLSGIDGNYDVHHDIPGEAFVCCVLSVRDEIDKRSRCSIGNAIVRALRARQSERISAELASRLAGKRRREYGVDTERKLAAPRDSIARTRGRFRPAGAAKVGN